MKDSLSLHELLSRVGQESSCANFTIDVRIEYTYGINLVRIELPLTQVVIRMARDGGCGEYGTFLRRTALSQVRPGELGVAIQNEIETVERIVAGVQNGTKPDGWFAPSKSSRIRSSSI